MQRVDTHLAVLVRGDDVLLVDLRSETALRETASAFAQGHILCGYFTAIDGVPSVECEPGLRVALGMMQAGAALAQMLGTAGALN